MECSHCGAENPKGAFICRECRATLPPVLGDVCAEALLARSIAYYALGGLGLLMITTVVANAVGLKWLMWLPITIGAIAAVVGLLSIVLGTYALVLIHRSDGQLDGRGIAMPWTIVSAVHVLFITTGILPPLLATMR